MPNMGGTGGGGFVPPAGYPGQPPPVGPMPGATAGIAALWFMTLLCTFFYFMPVLGAARAVMSYRVALFCTCLGYAISLWKQFPEHKFATLSEARAPDFRARCCCCCCASHPVLTRPRSLPQPRFKAAPESQFFMTCVILAIAPPIPFVLVRPARVEQLAIS